MSDKNPKINSLEYTASIQSTQRKILLTLLENQQFADVTFIIGEEEKQYQINRIFLSAISPVFNAMLYGKMQESNPNSEIPIKDETPEIFESIINFAYCNDPKINSNNVLLLIKSCDKYQITALSDICYDFFSSCLDKNTFYKYCVEAVELHVFNDEISKVMETYFISKMGPSLDGNAICKFLELTVQLNLHKLTQTCQELLQKHAKKVKQALQSHEFVKMKLKTVRSFLQISPLQIGEECLWDATLKWAEYQSKQTQLSDDEKSDLKSREYKIYLLKSVRDLIRFPLMRGTYFASFVEQENILSDQELITLLLYFQNPNRGCGQFSDKLRVPSLQQPFSVWMSSKWSKCSNTYASLITDDLSVGCATRNDQRETYIEAYFGGRTVNVTQIEIGLLSAHGWGPKDLNGVRLQMHDLAIEDWIDVKIISSLETKEIEKFTFKYGEIVTNKLRLFKGKKCYVGVGCWRIFGC